MSPLIFQQSKRPAPQSRSRVFAITTAKKQDARRLVDIEFHAFEDEQVNQVLSYRDYKKASHFERSVKLYEMDMMSERDPPRDPRRKARGRVDSMMDYSDQQPLRLGTTFRKVVDTETKDVVSFAKVEMKRYTAEELRSPASVGHEGEPKMNQDWFGLNERTRREYVGFEEHCYIGMLATQPKHQHYGAGTMLLEQILSEADSAGVEVYLEATDTAKGLYERHGFEAICELRFDPAKYGVKGLGTERQTVMVRPAMASHGERRPVRSWDVAAAQSRAQLRGCDSWSW